MNGKGIAIVILVIAGYSLYLQSRGKFLPVLDALFTSKTGASSGASSVNNTPVTPLQALLNKLNPIPNSVGTLDPNGQTVVPITVNNSTSTFAGLKPGELPSMPFSPGGAFGLPIPGK